NPIYYFYNTLKSTPHNIKAEEGDRFYQCYHGSKKILRVTKKMRNNLNGKVHSLIGNLRTCSPDMFKFYSYLKDCALQVLLSPEEKKIASGEIKLSSTKLAEFTQHHDAHQQSLKNAFAQQQEKVAEPWSQEKFEELLTKWIVASDQPFEEVENPEFANLLNYINRSPSSLKIPSHFTVAVSLDGWTSGNNYAFFA
ncbi:hypothetical protein L208DRAFT_1015671, partial [Tricholoma matsutake]